MGEQIRDLMDIKHLLRRFGFTVYTGDRLGDLELMETELADLFQAGLLEKETYLKAKGRIQQEKRRETNVDVKKKDCL
ncbi:YqgQ family protein [Melghirimyces algeriensis]|uniref:Uncharacterized protein YqgQ n=1 Tax=Melghirimyces algeriensis TaxID=910412 RepID=A0A521CKM3_9BACL|nr:YqgQ family protein [Melghirimyces algeriensis]SMO59230.1 Uncharacterized protein YqgQ [Melghirimyces algeriensis]